MAYDEGLAQRIREAIEGTPDVVEKRMFGGLAFMIRGHMTFGIVGDELMVRVGPEAHAASLALPHARPMTFTGKSLKAMVYVAVDGFAEDADLSAWLARGIAYTAALPLKEAKPARARTAQSTKKRAGGKT
jgi:TfoX/Sxy family transcriptional regulator of competence genes